MLYLSAVRYTRVRQDITIKCHVNKLRPLHTNWLVFMRLICKLVFEHYNLISNSSHLTKYVVVAGTFSIWEI